MRAFIKKLYYNTRTGYLIISIPKYFYDLFRFRLLPLLPEETYVKMQFRHIMGYELNIKNPQTFNEKIQWIKFNIRIDLYTLCADKLAVRDYIKEQIGEEYLIPLIFHTNNPEELTLDKLPDYPVIIKTNHASGNVVIVKNKYSIYIKRIQKKMKALLKENFYFRTKEWQYKNIKPQILVEKLLMDEYGNIPVDYKFHCFHGKVEAIQVDISRFTEHKRNFYDVQWSLLPFSLTYDVSNEIIRKPDNLLQMITLSEKLAAAFIYVRVDLYVIKDHIYFGELTFTSGNGMELFNPPKFDKILGDKLKLPIEI
jgi:hypothetical protein